MRVEEQLIRELDKAVKRPKETPDNYFRNKVFPILEQLKNIKLCSDEVDQVICIFCNCKYLPSLSDTVLDRLQPLLIKIFSDSAEEKSLKMKKCAEGWSRPVGELAFFSGLDPKIPEEKRQIFEAVEIALQRRGCLTPRCLAQMGLDLHHAEDLQLFVKLCPHPDVKFIQLLKEAGAKELLRSWALQANYFTFDSIVEGFDRNDPEDKRHLMNIVRIGVVKNPSMVLRHLGNWRLDASDPEIRPQLIESAKTLAETYSSFSFSLELFSSFGFHLTIDEDKALLRDLLKQMAPKMDVLRYEIILQFGYDLSDEQDVNFVWEHFEKGLRKHPFCLNEWVASYAKSPLGTRFKLHRALRLKEESRDWGFTSFSSYKLDPENPDDKEAVDEFAKLIVAERGILALYPLIRAMRLSPSIPSMRQKILQLCEIYLKNHPQRDMMPALYDERCISADKPLLKKLSLQMAVEHPQQFTYYGFQWGFDPKDPEDHQHLFKIAFILSYIDPLFRISPLFGIDQSTPQDHKKMEMLSLNVFDFCCPPSEFGFDVRLQEDRDLLRKLFEMRLRTYVTLIPYEATLQFGYDLSVKEDADALWNYFKRSIKEHPMLLGKWIASYSCSPMSKQFKDYIRNSKETE